MILSTSTNIFFERRFEEFVPMEKCLKMCEKSGYKYLDFDLQSWLLYQRDLKENSGKTN